MGSLGHIKAAFVLSGIFMASGVKRRFMMPFTAIMARYRISCYTCEKRAILMRSCRVQYQY
jgi:hypothetical protein